METKEGELELQEWQKEILEMSPEEYSLIIDEMETTHGIENEIPLQESQKKMLEKVLGDDFYIGDEGIRDTLQCVLELGFYFERDKEVLNLARECYLKGRNWIKKKHG